MDISCVLNRRSVREYTGESVADEDIVTLLKAGMYAPSAKNSQPFEYIVVRDRAKLDALSETSQYWQMLKKAPLAIIVVANLDGYQSSNRDFFIHDCAASTENILVAAEGLGLGAVWLGLYGVTDRMASVASILNIPDNIKPFSVISIGHPAKHPNPHTSFKEEKVHYDSY